MMKYVSDKEITYPWTSISKDAEFMIKSMNEMINSTGKAYLLMQSLIAKNTEDT